MRMGKEKTQVNQQIPIVYLTGRLWIPLSVFLFFLVSIFSKEELLERFLGNASLVVHQVVLYGTQIGLWMSSAFLIQRMVTVFVWDGLISGISGRPVPRLPKDVTALSYFWCGPHWCPCHCFRSTSNRDMGHFWGSQYCNRNCPA